MDFADTGMEGFTHWMQGQDGNNLQLWITLAGLERKAGWQRSYSRGHSFSGSYRRTQARVTTAITQLTQGTWRDS